MSTWPFAEKKFAEINGVRMAHIDEGEGDPIVFQHGNPTVGGGEHAAYDVSTSHREL